MNYFSKAISRLSVFSTLFIIAFMTSCGKQPPNTSEISNTNLSSPIVTVTSVILTPISTITPTVPAPTPTNTIYPTYSPRPTNTPRMDKKLQRLITVEEITAISDDIGIGEWKLEQEILRNASVCRYFLGQSWSASPNLATNCIFEAESGTSFAEAIKWLQDNQIIDPSSTSLQTTYDYDGDFTLYTFLSPNGHSVYDAFLYVNNLIYWASIDVGTPIGYSPESIFAESDGVIDTFLYDVLSINTTEGS